MFLTVSRLQQKNHIKHDMQARGSHTVTAQALHSFGGTLTKHLNISFLGLNDETSVNAFVNMNRLHSFELTVSYL